MTGAAGKGGITGPLFKWFGSKWLSAKTLPPPSYGTIIEPFAGGAGYSLRYHDRKIVLAESNPNASLLWAWLIHHATDRDILEIPLNLNAGIDIRGVGLTPGQAMLLKCWQRTNSVGDCWTVSKWGSLPGQWTANTRARVADQVQYVKHWKILEHCDQAFALSGLTRATWFVDPPYVFNYDYGIRGSNGLDYNTLAKVVRLVRGQVIVCEAACPKTGMAPDWLPFEFFGNRVTSRRKAGNHTHSKELIFTAEQN